MIPEFYTPNPKWAARIEEIVKLLGRISAAEEISGRRLELRRGNRISSVHASTAIEGNTLTRSQVESVAAGHPVFAPRREVQEVENALAAYEALDDLDPWDTDSFLQAHGLLTAGLITDPGAFRTVDVDIVNLDGEVLHSGSRPAKVPRLVAELLEWGRASGDHPIVVSSAVHFLIEHIHPFRDGNGRIGRLWQTLILSKWQPAFAWLPVETLIRSHQSGYYTALQASREPEIDAATFIDFMLDVIHEALTSYERHAVATATGVGDNDGDNVGDEGHFGEALLDALRRQPTLSAAALAKKFGKSQRTIERHLAQLKAAGKLGREGSARAGRWAVTESQ